MVDGINGTVVCQIFKDHFPDSALPRSQNQIKMIPALRMEVLNITGCLKIY